jgi:hypothetical protein
MLFISKFSTHVCKVRLCLIKDSNTLSGSMGICLCYFYFLHCCKIRREVSHGNQGNSIKMHVACKGVTTDRASINIRSHRDHILMFIGSIQKLLMSTPQSTIWPLATVHGCAVS